MSDAGKRLLAAAREMRETVRQDMDSVEIPNDIRETAKRVWNEEDWSAHGAMELIARAILAERERCANIAHGVWLSAGGGDFGGGMADAAQSIEDQIRNGA
jgi:hypothetical protein